MTVRAQLPLAQQEREENAQKPETGKDPHPEAVA